MAAFTPRTLRAGDSVVTAYDHGAHVASWDVNDVPVVWVSRRSQYVSGTAIRGGIPICWPWFADGPSGDRTPSHGLARTHVWELVEQRTDSATWRLPPSTVRSADADLDTNVECEMYVRVTSESLHIKHTTSNLGDADMSYELALHTYLHVGDVRHVEVQGLADVAYFDKVLETSTRQDGPLAITQRIDRIYHSPGPIRVVDPILHRSLSVRSEGAMNTVVWNPGLDGAAAMKDFGDEEWTHMLCVETANLDEHAVHLQPGQSHTTTALIETSTTP